VFLGGGGGRNLLTQRKQYKGMGPNTISQALSETSGGLTVTPRGGEPPNGSPPPLFKRTKRVIVEERVETNVNNGGGGWSFTRTPSPWENL